MLFIFVVAIVEDKLCVFLNVALMLNANSFDPDCSQIFEEAEECQVLSELNEEIDLAMSKNMRTLNFQPMR